VAVVLVLGAAESASPCAVQDLHAQAAAAILARDFTSPDLSYLLLDEDGRIIAQRWEHAERDVPVGSLVKPFLAVAYGQTHQTFPRFRCVGKKTCWLARGHGTLQIRDAIAFSCNSYFHQLVASAGSNFERAYKSFDLHGDLRPQQASSSSGSAAPLRLAQTYLELTRRSHDTAVRPVLEGMALSARKGTGKAAGAELPNTPMLAKTGTAPCTHAKRAPGDGFALLMAPADHPRAVLLVRLHGRPGYIAAGVAGRMMAEVESGGSGE
jgi:cell division protein FtsI/penicillin-binding protein 2